MVICPISKVVIEMSKKKEKKIEQESYGPMATLAIALMYKWAKDSIKSVHNSMNIEKYLLISDENQVLTAYTHIRKFRSFPNERFFNHIGERISQQDLAFSRDFLRSKLRSNGTVKIDMEPVRRR